jgi:electron transfer flavoprotein alpha subunit
LVVGQTNVNLASLGEYGVKKVIHADDATINSSNNQCMATIIANAAVKFNADTIVFSNTISAKGIAPRVSVKMKAGMVTGAVSLPDITNGFVVKKNVFSGKAFADINILSNKKIITLNSNAFEISKPGGEAVVEKLEVEKLTYTVKITAVHKIEGETPLAEADKVVSAGRGMKGPENWGMIEELAKLLGAATACSRPVSDSDWGPHHEHVGQTGLSIAPNLYIAVGISGAIQHLAGVNRSKTIVVINKDPEAPFFKSADYGIVGDAFDVVPKIIAAVKAL